MIAGYFNLQVEDWGIAKQKINNLELKKMYEKVIKTIKEPLTCLKLQVFR